MQGCWSAGRAVICSCGSNVEHPLLAHYVASSMSCMAAWRRKNASEGGREASKGQALAFAEQQSTRAGASAPLDAATTL